MRKITAGDRAVQHLPESLRRCEAVSFGNREPPCADLLRRELGKAHLTQRGGAFPSSQRSFATVTRSP